MMRIPSFTQAYSQLKFQTSNNQTQKLNRGKTDVASFTGKNEPEEMYFNFDGKPKTYNELTSEQRAKISEANNAAISDWHESPYYDGYATWVNLKTGENITGSYPPGGNWVLSNFWSFLKKD